jgi:hypothetical protein
MKNILKPGSLAFAFGLMLTTLGQAQQGAPSGTPLSFKVPPHASSAMSFSTAPNVQCSVAPANGSGSGQAFTVYTNDEGTATFYVTPSQESSSAAQLVATCSSGDKQTIEIRPVAGAKPLVARAPSNAATNARLGYTVRPALTGDPMALSNAQLVKLKYPLRPDPQKAPGAYARWLKAVSKPATFIPPKTVNVEGRYHGPAKISADAGTTPRQSANWSGYALYGGVNQRAFVWIQGDWNVPSLVGGESGENGSGTFSALWIRLDGEGETNDVVMDGTEQFANYFTVNPFSIPEEWGRAFAMVVARDKVAAVWGARDPGGTIYLYAEHALPHAEPSENARAIRAREVSIPGLIHIAGSTEAFRVAHLYQQLGLHQVQCCGSVGDAALFQFWQLLATNQLKIFASLSMFLEEYRIGEEQSPLLLCAQSLVSRLDLMVCKEPKSEDDEFEGWGTSSPFYGHGGWMR